MGALPANRWLDEAKAPEPRDQKTDVRCRQVSAHFQALTPSGTRKGAESLRRAKRQNVVQVFPAEGGKIFLRSVSSSWDTYPPLPTRDKCLNYCCLGLLARMCSASGNQRNRSLDSPADSLCCSEVLFVSRFSPVIHMLFLTHRICINWIPTRRGFTGGNILPLICPSSAPGREVRPALALCRLSGSHSDQIDDR